MHQKMNNNKNSHIDASRHSIRRFTPLMVFLMAFTAIFALSLTWAVTTPLGASPDEPAHFIKGASVVRGQLIGVPSERPNAQDRKVLVPPSVANTTEIGCYAFKQDATAGCFVQKQASDKLVESVTTAGLYNPVYYVLAGWPSLISTGQDALFMMRAMSALLCSLFFAAAITFLSRLRKPTLPVLVGFALITPMTYFLAGSFNPNSLEIATTAAFFAGLIYFIREKPQLVLSQWWTAAALGASGAILVQMRGISPLWLGFSVLVAMILAGPAIFLKEIIRPPYLWSVITVALSLVMAVIWTVKSQSLPAVGEHSGAGTTFIGGVWKMLETTFDYLKQGIGVFGWLDTPAPSYVIFSYFVGLGLLVTAALLVAPRGRQRASIVVATCGFLLLPAIVQGASVTNSGYVWQGRYSLPGLVTLMILAAALGASGFERLSKNIRAKCIWTIAIAYALIQYASVMTALKRYSVGLSQSWVAVFNAPEWRPPILGNLGWSLVAAFVCSVLAVVMIVLSKSQLPFSKNPESLTQRAKSEGIQ